MQNIISQVIAGILTAIAIWLLRSLHQKLTKLFRAKTIKELTNISFNAITNFLPLIISLFVLASEIWFISPWNIIDLTFMNLSLFVIVGNIVLAIFMNEVIDIKHHQIDNSEQLELAKSMLRRSEEKLDKYLAEFDALKKKYGIKDDLTLVPSPR